MKVGTVPQVLVDMFRLRKGCLTDLGHAFAAHLSKGFGAPIAFFPVIHIVTTDGAQSPTTFGYTCCADNQSNSAVYDRVSCEVIRAPSLYGCKMPVSSRWPRQNRSVSCVGQSRGQPWLVSVPKYLAGDHCLLHQIRQPPWVVGQQASCRADQ
jgi:hypothetical protein